MSHIHGNQQWQYRIWMIVPWIKNYDLTLPEDMLAYKFLNNTNISEQHKQLVHETLSELNYDQNKD